MTEIKMSKIERIIGADNLKTMMSVGIALTITTAATATILKYTPEMIPNAVEKIGKTIDNFGKKYTEKINALSDYIKSKYSSAKK
jgi:hypothetical protein